MKDNYKKQLKIEDSFPIIYQKSINDCGLACWKIVLQYYNAQHLFPCLNKIEIKNKKGLNLLDMISIANKLNIKSFWVNISSQVDLEKIPKPSILILNDKHYCVYYKYTNHLFYIADPLIGKYKCTSDVLLKKKVKAQIFEISYRSFKI